MNIRTIQKHRDHNEKIIILFNLLSTLAISSLPVSQIYFETDMRCFEFVRMFEFSNKVDETSVFDEF